MSTRTEKGTTVSIATIEADIKTRVENARAHIETFVNEHMAGIHQTLGDLSTEVERAAASPVVSEVEALLPAQVTEAVRLVETFLVDAAKATAQATPAEPSSDTPAPADVPGDAQTATA